MGTTRVISDDVEELKFSYLTFLLLYFRLGCSSKSAEKFMSAWVQQADGELHQSLQDLHRQRRQKRSSVQNLFAMGMVQMLPGEMVWTETLDVAWSLTTGGSKKTSIQGGLYATNYRLIFVCFPSQFDDEVGSGAERARNLNSTNLCADEATQQRDRLFRDEIKAMHQPRYSI